MPFLCTCVHTTTPIMYLLFSIQSSVGLVLNCKLTVEVSVTGGEDCALVKTVLCESVVWSLRLFDLRYFLGFRHTLSFSYLTNEKIEVELNCPSLNLIGSRSPLKMYYFLYISIKIHFFVLTPNWMLTTMIMAYSKLLYCPSVLLKILSTCCGFCCQYLKVAWSLLDYKLHGRFRCVSCGRYSAYNTLTDSLYIVNTYWTRVRSRIWK